MQNRCFIKSILKSFIFKVSLSEKIVTSKLTILNIILNIDNLIFKLKIEDNKNTDFKIW